MCTKKRYRCLIYGVCVRPSNARKKKKHPCPKRRRRTNSRKRCSPPFNQPNHRPFPLIVPILQGNIAADSPRTEIAHKQECCGNILLTNTFPKMLIWERESSASLTEVQISVYASPSNTEVLKLRIESDTGHDMDVLPGNTASFWGQRARKVYAFVSETAPSTYVEGKYVIYATSILR